MSVFNGKILRMEVRGASHSGHIGFSLDGFPSGVEIDEAALAAFMKRRAPGNDPYSTPRRENDEVEFLGGIENGVTTGRTILGRIANTDFRPADYGAERTIPRPGHADFPQWVRFGRIPTGGGSNSGRMTAALAAAGGICIQYLGRSGISISSRLVSVGGKTDGLEDEILSAKAEGDSVGGIVECTVSGAGCGLGGSLFDGVECVLSSLVFAIPGVKGIEFGNGFAASSLRGSGNNDAFVADGGKVSTATNRHGGILGGRTSGMPVVFRVAMKPTPTVFKELESVDLATMSSAKCRAKGRHDPCIARRGMPVIEAAAAIAFADVIAAYRRETPSICLVLARPTLEENVVAYESNRYFADVVELRADKLDENERENVSSVLEKIDVPVILTFRRRRDGGDFDGDETVRRNFFGRVFASGAKFAYVDFEDDFRDDALSRAAHSAGTKIIRSMHDFGGKNWNLADVAARLSENGEIPKIAFAPRSLSETAEFFREAMALAPGPRILCAMGREGVATRILASKLGSLWSYASQGGIDAGIGHLSPLALVRDFRVRSFSKDAGIKFVAGENSFSRAVEMNARFAVGEEDAVAVPFEGFPEEEVSAFARKTGFGELI